VFLDTSVLLAGLVDFGPQSAPAQSLLHAVAEKQVTAPATAWHCCLEAHIAEVARAAGAAVVVTDNRRHFLAALRHGLRVETPTEFTAGLRPKRS
jgi:hypothetical protein